MNEELITNNIQLIYLVLKNMGLYEERDVYYDVGLIALVKASQTFDKERGYKFSTYASTFITNDICTYITHELRHKRKANYHTISLEETIYEGDNKEVTLIDAIPSDFDLEEEVIKNERNELLYKIISILEPNDRFMMEHYFELWGKQKMNQVEIAKELGVDQRYVSYRIKRSMGIIKKIMEDKYGE